MKDVAVRVSDPAYRVRCILEIRRGSEAPGMIDPPARKTLTCAPVPQISPVFGYTLMLVELHFAAKATVRCPNVLSRRAHSLHSLRLPSKSHTLEVTPPRLSIVLFTIFRIADARLFRLIFVCLTNILLITSLISLVSNSLTEVGSH